MKSTKSGLFVLLSAFLLSAGLNPALANEPIKRGPRPSPSPSETATPAPAPTDPAPEETPAPEVVDTAQAVREGQSDGNSAGIQEGRERGAQDGLREGQAEGQRQGYERCTREESDRHYDLGFTDGYRSGGNEGDYDGRERGQTDGFAQGQIDGREDGQKRADQDARRDATPVGRARGIEEANHSDATDRGTADGIVAGDRQARDRAIELDYARGRKDVRDERFAEPITHQDEFAQRTNAAPALVTKSTLAAKTNFLQSLLNNANRGEVRIQDGEGADFRYFKPSRTYSTPEENQAYLDAYRIGYLAGFRTEYANSRQFAYQQGYNHSYQRGCEQARRRDYREFYNRGFEVGHRDGYRAAFDRSYEQARRNAYNRAFPEASDIAYRETYPRAYDRHYETARAAAYSERVDELYGAAFEHARVAKFNQMYPVYAAEEYKRGRKDEAQDFVERPVRLLAADVTETIENGLMEPGEALRLRVVLRNFAAGSLNGKDIKLKIEALDRDAAVITQGEAALVKNLREKSSTTVSEALEFRMNESSVKQAKSFRVTGLFQGKKIGELVIRVKAQFMVDVAFAEEMTVKDGLPTQVKLRITNQSLKATDASLRIKFTADTRQLEIANPEQVVSGLNPGESRVIEYTVIARTSEEQLRIPLAVSVSGGGRRVGLMDLTEQAPVVNDYRVTLSGSTANLSNPGIVRVTYKVRNTGSRLLYKSLQLTVAIKNTENPDAFAIIGPSTQFLLPLEKGEQTSFVIPILVKSANSGGVLELELKEDGQTAVVHQAAFGQASRTLN